MAIRDADTLFGAECRGSQILRLIPCEFTSLTILCIASHGLRDTIEPLLKVAQTFARPVSFC